MVRDMRDWRRWRRGSLNPGDVQAVTRRPSASGPAQEGLRDGKGFWAGARHVQLGLTPDPDLC